MAYQRKNTTIVENTSEAVNTNEAVNADQSNDAVVTATSDTGICHGPTI